MKTLLTLGILFVTTTLLSAQEWETYTNEELGLEMLSVKGITFKETSNEKGWKTVAAESGPVKFYLIHKAGEKHTPQDIAAVGVHITKIPPRFWKRVDGNKNVNGWEWFEAYYVNDTRTAIFSGMGTGPKGSYLIFLQSTVADVLTHQKDYEKWYKSLKLK